MAKSLRDIVKTVTPEIEQNPAMPPEKAKEKEFIDVHKIGVHGELPWEKLGVDGPNYPKPTDKNREPQGHVRESIDIDLDDLTEEQIEVLDEVSKGLVSRYRAKASDDLHHGRSDGGPLRPWNHADTDEEGERHRKRNAGIGMADKKLGRHYTSDKTPAKVRATESVEMVDEAHSTKQLKQAREYHHNRSDSYVDTKMARKSHLHRKAAKIATRMLQKRSGDQDSD